MSNGHAPGSSGNVLAALCSFFIPGLGQLVQGRIMMALVHFLIAASLWILCLGWTAPVIHILSCIDAARYRG